MIRFVPSIFIRPFLVLLLCIVTMSGGIPIGSAHNTSISEKVILAANTDPFAKTAGVDCPPGSTFSKVGADSKCVGIRTDSLNPCALGLAGCGTNGTPDVSVDGAKQTILRLLDIVFLSLGFIATLILIIEGILLILARGSDDRRKKITTTIVNIFLGFALIIFSYAIVRFIVTVLSGGEEAEKAVKMSVETQPPPPPSSSMSVQSTPQNIGSTEIQIGNNTTLPYSNNNRTLNVTIGNKLYTLTGGNNSIPIASVKEELAVFTIYELNKGYTGTLYETCNTSPKGNILQNNKINIPAPSLTAQKQILYEAIAGEGSTQNIVRTCIMITNGMPSPDTVLTAIPTFIGETNITTQNQVVTLEQTKGPTTVKVKVDTPPEIIAKVKIISDVSTPQNFTELTTFPDSKDVLYNQPGTYTMRLEYITNDGQIFSRQITIQIPKDDTFFSINNLVENENISLYMDTTLNIKTSPSWGSTITSKKITFTKVNSSGEKISDYSQSLSKNSDVLSILASKFDSAGDSSQIRRFKVTYDAQYGSLSSQYNSIITILPLAPKIDVALTPNALTGSYSADYTLNISAKNVLDNKVTMQVLDMDTSESIDVIVNQNTEIVERNDGMYNVDTQKPISISFLKKGTYKIIIKGKNGGEETVIKEVPINIQSILSKGEIIFSDVVRVNTGYTITLRNGKNVSKVAILGKNNSQIIFSNSFLRPFGNSTSFEIPGIPKPTKQGDIVYTFSYYEAETDTIPRVTETVTKQVLEELSPTPVVGITNGTSKIDLDTTAVCYTTSGNSQKAYVVYPSQTISLDASSSKDMSGILLSNSTSNVDIKWYKNNQIVTDAVSKKYTFPTSILTTFNSCLTTQLSITENGKTSLSPVMYFILKSRMPVADRIELLGEVENLISPVSLTMQIPNLIDDDSPTRMPNVDWYYSVNPGNGIFFPIVPDAPTYQNNILTVTMAIPKYGYANSKYTYTFKAILKDNEATSGGFFNQTYQTKDIWLDKPVVITNPADEPKTIGINISGLTLLSNKDYTITYKGVSQTLTAAYTNIAAGTNIEKAEWKIIPSNESEFMLPDGSICKATNDFITGPKDDPLGITFKFNQCGGYIIILTVSYKGQTETKSIPVKVVNTEDQKNNEINQNQASSTPLRTPLALYASTTLDPIPRTPYLSPHSALGGDEAPIILAANSDIFIPSGFGVKPLTNGVSRGEAFGLFDTGADSARIEAIKRKLQATDGLFPGLTNSQLAILDKLKGIGAGDRLVLNKDLLKQLFGNKPGFGILSPEELELVRRLAGDSSTALRKKLDDAQKKVVDKLKNILEGVDMTPLTEAEKKVRDALVSRFVSSTPEANLEILQKLFGKKPGLAKLTPGEIELLAQLLDNEGNVKKDGLSPEEIAVAEKLKNKLEGKDTTPLTEEEKAVKEKLMKKLGISDPEAAVIEKLQGVKQGIAGLKDKIADATKGGAGGSTGNGKSGSGLGSTSPFDDPSTQNIFGCAKTVQVRLPGGTYGLACNDKNIFSDSPDEIANILKQLYPNEYEGLFAPLIKDMAPESDPQKVKQAMEKILATLRVLGAPEEVIEAVEIAMAKRFVEKNDRTNAVNESLQSGADELARTLSSILGGEKEVSEETIESLITTFQRIGDGGYEYGVAQTKMIQGLEDIIKSEDIGDSVKGSVMDGVEKERIKLLEELKQVVTSSNMPEREKKVVLQSFDELISMGKAAAGKPGEQLQLFKKTLSSLATLLDSTLLNDKEKDEVRARMNTMLRSLGSDQAKLLSTQFQQSDPVLLRSLQQTEKVLRAQSALKRGSDSLLHVVRVINEQKNLSKETKTQAEQMIKQQLQQWADNALLIVDKSTSLTKDEKIQLVAKLNAAKRAGTIQAMLEKEAEVYQILQTKPAFIAENKLYTTLSEDFSIMSDNALSSIRAFISGHEKISATDKKYIIKELDFAQQRLFASTEVVDGLLGIYRALKKNKDVQEDMKEVDRLFFSHFLTLRAVAEGAVRGDRVRVLLPLFLVFAKEIDREEDERIGVEKRILQYKDYYRMILNQQYYYNIAKAKMSSITEGFVFEMRSKWEPFMKKAHLSYYDSAETDLMEKIGQLNELSGSPEKFALKVDEIQLAIRQSKTLPLTVKNNMLRAFEENGVVKSVVDAQKNCSKVYVKDPLMKVRYVCTYIRTKEDLQLISDSEQKKLLEQEVDAAIRIVGKTIPANNVVQSQLIDALRKTKDTYLAEQGNFLQAVREVSALSQDPSLTEDQQNTVRSTLYAVPILREQLQQVEDDTVQKKQQQTIQRARAEKDMLQLQSYVEQVDGGKRVVAQEALLSLNDALYRDQRTTDRSLSTLYLIVHPTLKEQDQATLTTIAEKYGTVDKNITHTAMTPERLLTMVRVLLEEFTKETQFTGLQQRHGDMVRLTKEGKYLEAVGAVDGLKKDIEPLFTSYPKHVSQWKEVLDQLKSYYVYLDEKKTAEYKAQELLKEDTQLGQVNLNVSLENKNSNEAVKEPSTPSPVTNVFMTIILWLAYILGGGLALVLILAMILYVFYLFYKRKNPDVHMDFEEYMLDAREHILSVFGIDSHDDEGMYHEEQNDLPRMPQTELPPEEETNQEAPVVEGEVVSTETDEMSPASEEHVSEEVANEETLSDTEWNFDDTENEESTPEDTTVENTEVQMPSTENFSTEHSSSSDDEELETPSWLLDETPTDQLSENQQQSIPNPNNTPPPPASGNFQPPQSPV